MQEKNQEPIPASSSSSPSSSSSSSSSPPSPSSSSSPPSPSSSSSPPSPSSSSSSSSPSSYSSPPSSSSSSPSSSSPSSSSSPPSSSSSSSPPSSSSYSSPPSSSSSSSPPSSPSSSASSSSSSSSSSSFSSSPSSFTPPLPCPEERPPSGPSVSWSFLLYTGAYGGALALGAFFVPSLFPSSSSSPGLPSVSLIPDASLSSLSSSLASLSPSPPVVAPFSHFLRLLASSSLKTVALFPASAPVILYSPHSSSSPSLSSPSLSSSSLSSPSLSSPSLSSPSSLTSPVGVEELSSVALSAPLFLTRAVPGSEAELARLLIHNEGVEVLQVLGENAWRHTLEGAYERSLSLGQSVLEELLEVILAFAGLAALSTLLYFIGRYYNLLPPVPPSVWGRERRREPPSFSRVTFADVAGHGEAKKQLRQVIQFLRSPQAFDALGARAPRGILLEGPTGTGKTLLARAVAGESSVPFLSISGGSFVELYVGQGAARVRALFEAAKAQAPCVVFIDEFDAIALDRKECIGGSSQEYVQTVNELLYQLDGMERPSGGGLHSAGLRGARGSDPTLEKASFAASEASACAPSYEKETTPASFLASLKRALAFPLFFPFLHRSATPRGSSDARGNCEAPSPSQDSPSALPPPIVVLAATNRVAALDEAVKRPGRFDIIVRIDLPSEGER
uniref:ATPase, AAA family domain-containing protein,putative n=1 Tax=Neospora caninum (strain Liverpool) TaxID=572307 RepID=A0A0F7U8Z6_NEOCL|nr:TPA: ATPase, AAA family domain-containing protein,putative [Neospora caninum Liverpool]